MSDLLQSLKSDAKYKKYRNILKTVRGRINVEADMDEILSLHAGRNSRRLFGKDQFSPKAIYEATAQDLSIRARLVEIRQRTSVQSSLLEGAIDQLHKYIRTSYRNSMRGLSNEASRKAGLDAVTNTGNELIVEARTLIDTADQIIRDVDQSGHSIRHMVEILKLLDSSKGKIA